MNVNDARQEFERFAEGCGSNWSVFVPAQAIKIMGEFYRTVRANGCDLENDGDMLLFQWGTYDWGSGKHFSFDITRQFILEDEEDGSVFQLHLKFEFPTSAATDALIDSNRWCNSPSELDAFNAWIQQHPAYQNAAGRSDGKVKLEFEDAE